MAYSAEVGSELGADHRLIELLGRQLDLETDPARRQAAADKIAGIIDWHEKFDRAYLGADEPADSAEQTAEAAAAASLDELLARARRHIRQEEDHTLPAFESHAHWMVLEDLGERAREMRQARSVRPGR